MTRRNRQSPIDDLFEMLLVVPWWVGPIVGILAFLLFRYFMPLVALAGLGDHPVHQTIRRTLSSVSVSLAPYASLVVLIGWGCAELKKYLDRKRLDHQTGLDSIGQLSWQQFERLLAEAFRRQGYHVEHRGSSSGDGGVDLVLWRDRAKTLVQCKHWKERKVGVQPVRELLGVVTAEKAAGGILVTSGDYTEQAREFARGNTLTLIDGPALEDLIRTVQRQASVQEAGEDVPSECEQRGAAPDSPPHCPDCGAPMVRRVAKRGPDPGSRFWGCPRFPACRGTRP